MFKIGTAILIFIILLSGCAGTGDKFTTVTDPKIKPPVLLNKPEFTYPEEAQNKGIEGVVNIYVYINDSGNVKASKIVNSSNYNLLDEAAKAYVMQMKFKPAYVDKKAIGIWLSYKINYTFIDSGENFQLEVHLNNLAQYLNDAASGSGSERQQAIQMVMELNRRYTDFVREYPENNYNQMIAKQLTRNTIDDWGRFFDFWPLTFILNYDLIVRFPEYSNIISIKDQMMTLMYEDLTRAVQIDQSGSELTQRSVEFAKELRAYLNQNYPGQVPDDLNREIDKLNILY